ncbi:MAG: PDC sensor domain-containing protein [Proteobacteria bacterium]|nr:PDC sensor domain-containing protein [Pseudomonadota bacterium]
MTQSDKLVVASIQQTILAKKQALAENVKGPLGSLAENCAQAWDNADSIDKTLAAAINDIPSCHLLYAWNVDGIEVSSMVRPDGIDPSWQGRDLSERPYLKNNLPFMGIMISSVYLSEYTQKQCITALQAVRRDEELLGFIAADFAINDLIKNDSLATPETHWQQFRGDPAVRSTVFMQTRAQSLMDDHIDEAMDLIRDLMVNHGVFHAKIHFSSGRCSFWLMEDPYSYRIHMVDELIDPELCLAYPVHPYPEKAKVTPEQIRRVFEEFRTLRFADETIYLRSSSINIMNGMLGLTFSCDGSHYMPVDEFLERDISFWLGSLGGEKTSNA